MNKIKVLIVDDSSVIRKMVEKILSFSQEIEVVGSAPDPYVAREMIAAHRPDVMILDVEMPRMDGISFLEKVMEHFPVRTIIFSSLTKEGSDTYLRAMESGAIEVMEKPTINVSSNLESIGAVIIEKVKQVARARIQITKKMRQTGPVVKVATTSLAKTTHQLIAIASSTGGTEALKVLLSGMPADIPGTLIVQHMPPGFTKSFADNLDKMFPFQVREAQDGDLVSPGKVFIAPGNYHMEIKRNGAYYHIKLHQDVPLHSVRPAADYLMKSVAKYVGANAIGIVLTGMGRDGAEGLLEMKNAGAITYGQNEATSVVYGMPQAAKEIGAVDHEMALDKIAADVMRKVRERSVA